MAKIIETESLVKSFGPVRALGGVSLSIEDGEWVSIMGPSGSGKSTLVNLLAGLDRADSGRLAVCGRDLSPMTESERAAFRRECVGLVFQSFYLIPYLTALENVMLAQYFHSTTDPAEAAKALQDVGLGDRAHHLPSQLSGGEQQRVCVARALINHPKLLLADEPTGNLDEANERAVVDLFRELHRRGHTIITVTHDLDIGKLAQRRIVLAHGRIVEPHMVPEGLEQVCDEILEGIWKAREEDVSDPVQILQRTPGSSREALAHLQNAGLVDVSSEALRLRSEGESRARMIVRRHRLAEKLFYEVFEVDQDEMQINACQVEHILSTPITDSICSFLGHPTACPHGRPIPPGHCCSHPVTPTPSRMGPRPAARPILPPSTERC